jgi:hypothetical protein
MAYSLASHRSSNQNANVVAGTNNNGISINNQNSQPNNNDSSGPNPSQTEINMIIDSQLEALR